MKRRAVSGITSLRSSLKNNKQNEKEKDASPLNHITSIEMIKSIEKIGKLLPSHIDASNRSRQRRIKSFESHGGQIGPAQFPVKSNSSP